jgi:mono/diheme cytochrome c family protein
VLSVLAACGTKEGREESLNWAEFRATVANGEIVYKSYCLTCHLATGKGAPPMNPPLLKTSFVTGDKKVLIDIVLEGMKNLPVDGKRYRNVMPPFDHLTDKEIADVLTYVRTTFGNGGEPVTESEVKSSRNTDQ